MVEQAAKQAKKQPIDIRPADLLKPEWEELRAAALALKGCNGTDEDVLTYAMFPQVAAKFFATRAEGPKNLGKDPQRASRAAGTRAARRRGTATARAPYARRSLTTSKLNGKTHKVTVSPGIEQSDNANDGRQ